MSKKALNIIPLIFPVIIVLGIVFGVKIKRNREAASVPQTTSVQTPTPMVIKSDEEQIKDALVKKHDWDPDDIKITVSENDGQYATGGVGAETPQGGGGIWFAAKMSGVWNIVWDGNGVVMCEDLTNYPKFPVDLIPQCYDSTTNTMVER